MKKPILKKMFVLKSFKILTISLFFTISVHGQTIDLVKINGYTASGKNVLLKLKDQPNAKITDIGVRSEAVFKQDGIKRMKSYKTMPSLFLVSIEGGGMNKLTDEEGGVAIMKKCADLMATGRYEYVEPDWECSLNSIPTDSFLRNSLWGFNNYGQRIVSSFGTPGVDINILPAWEITRGSSDVVVAVIDTGVDYTHLDIVNNMWVNQVELNGIPGYDDDQNGFIDDIYGCDTRDNDGDPYDEYNDPEFGTAHGTAVAGIIAATADNQAFRSINGAMVGVAPEVKIMACKVFAAAGRAALCDIIDGIDYAIDNGADVINLSIGGSEGASPYITAISRAREANIICVASAGNRGDNNDNIPVYPASVPLDNVISVAAVNNSGDLTFFSNHGVNSVDLAAPGDDIFSIQPFHLNEIFSGYTTHFGGTSAAAPHVAGVAALLKSVYPDITISEYRDRLLNSVTPLDSLSNTTSSGGMVNAFEAITGDFSTNLGDLRRGVLVTESRSGAGYLLYNPSDISVRLGLSGNQADHFVAVYLDNGDWYYDDNAGGQRYTPQIGDLIVASLDFTNDTATLLEGQSGYIEGIEYGYASGDLEIIANEWDGEFNEHEYGLRGDYITTIANNDQSLGELRRGVLVSEHSAIEYSPRVGDLIVADLNFTDNTVTFLEAQSGYIEGIEFGYAIGDLQAITNQWNGMRNVNEFELRGSFLDRNLSN